MPIRYRDCELCGYTFPAKTAKARFCSDAHRSAAGRARRNEEALLAEQGQAPAQVLPSAPSSTALDGEALRVLVEQAVAAQLGALERRGGVPEEEAAVAPPSEPTYGPTETATRTRLAAAGRTETYLGQSAIMLAFRIDNSSGETLSALAAGTKALAERMSAALGTTSVAAASGQAVGEDTSDGEAGAVASVDPIEEARRRREARRFGA